VWPLKCIFGVERQGMRVLWGWMGQGKNGSKAVAGGGTDLSSHSPKKYTKTTTNMNCAVLTRSEGVCISTVFGAVSNKTKSEKREGGEGEGVYPFPLSKTASTILRSASIQEGAPCTRTDPICISHLISASRGPRSPPIPLMRFKNNIRP
jgi:hypothetical protein